MRYEDRFLGEIAIYDEEAHIDLWYPDTPEAKVRKLVIGLIDVRAADDIRVSYDKERDGWKIEQASIFVWYEGEEVFDPDWQEVAFVQAWSRKDCTSNKVMAKKESP